MLPPFACFIMFHDDDMDTQKLQEVSFEENKALIVEEKKIGKKEEQEIEIVELAQTSKLSHKNTNESPDLTTALNPNYWQSLKNVMSCKVK